MSGKKDATQSLCVLRPRDRGREGDVAQHDPGHEAAVPRPAVLLPPHLGRQALRLHQGHGARPPPQVASSRKQGWQSSFSSNGIIPVLSALILDFALMFPQLALFVCRPCPIKEEQMVSAEQEKD